MKFLPKQLKLRSLCLLLALILALTALPLAGCGDKNTSGSDDDDEREESKKPGKDEKEEEEDEEFSLPGTYVLTGVHSDSTYFDRDMLALSSAAELFATDEEVDEKALLDLDNDMVVQFSKYKLILNEDHTGDLDGIDLVWREDEDGITLYENEEAMANNADPVSGVIDGSSLRLYTDKHDKNFYEVFRHEEKVTPFEKYDGDHYGTYRSLYVFNDSFLDRSGVERQIFENDRPIETAIEIADYYFDDVNLQYPQNGMPVLSCVTPDGEKITAVIEGEPGGRIFTMRDPDGDDSYPVIFYRDYAIVFGVVELGLLIMTTKQVPEPEKWIWFEDDPEFSSNAAVKAIGNYFDKIREKDFDGLVQSMPESVIKFAAKKDNRGVAEEYIYLADRYEDDIGTTELPEIKINTAFKMSSEEIEEMLSDGAEDGIELDELWKVSPYEEFWKVGATAGFENNDSIGWFVVIQLKDGMWVFDSIIFDTVYDDAGY